MPSNRDIKALVRHSTDAKVLVDQMLQGGDRPEGRQIVVRHDPSHQYYVQIPLFTKGGRFVQLFRPRTKKPEEEMKNFLRKLVVRKAGYQVWDIFVTPWGNFRISDTFDIESA